MNNNDKLILNTALLRKESEFRTKSCMVEKAIAVSHAEFDDLKRHPLRDNKMIAENAELMPDIAGIGLFDGNNFGIYVANGDVVFASYDLGNIVKLPVSEGNWVSWCTFEGIDYPQEVTDRIEEIQNPTEENTEEKNENGE